jgi:hypothetical protein
MGTEIGVGLHANYYFYRILTKFRIREQVLITFHENMLSGSRVDVD